MQDGVASRWCLAGRPPPDDHPLHPLAALLLARLAGKDDGEGTEDGKVAVR